MNNDEFVDGLRNQEPAAAKHLSECYLPVVWRFVFVQVNGDRHLAEDIVSESVLALVSAIGDGVKIEYPTAWLRKVATRRIQDHFRAAARVAHLVENVSAIAASESNQTPEADHDSKLRRQEIRDALMRLPEAYRMALEWKYIDGVSVRVIAERLNATEKSAESILFRARKSFRDQVRLHIESASELTSQQPSSRLSADSAEQGESPARSHPEPQPPSNEIMRSWL
ncbi:RNA polymerase sigma factor [Planctomycetes bacterium K23_9]|uniref:RNA polymerase sigma factor SigM n=1 Tax=Stieleria marina TaxID=1930275 RepID=A0A517P0N4_9BACT|nr:RNA polymerase sigma factor SigM [Planctomycetes bacterium K23_9]